ncbi:MAG: phosphatase PAP2 family protein [Pseudomonadota bacterium]
MKGSKIDPAVFYPPIFAAILLVPIALFYRFQRVDERIANALVVTVLFCFYSTAATVFIHALPPFGREPIDPILIEMEGGLGYSWVGLSGWMAEHPLLNEIFRSAYISTMGVMMLALLWLAAQNDRKGLHKFLISTMWAGTLTTVVWVAIPTVGPSAFLVLDPEVEAVVRPLADSQFGIELNRIMAEGIPHITAIEMKGLIGFPSFHTVMVVLPIICVWHYAKARWLFVAIALITAPSILVHGGHNFVDLIGGAAVSLASFAIASRMFRQMDETDAFQQPVGLAPKPA